MGSKIEAAISRFSDVVCFQAGLHRQLLSIDEPYDAHLFRVHHCVFRGLRDKYLTMAMFPLRVVLLDALRRQTVFQNAG